MCNFRTERATIPWRARRGVHVTRDAVRGRRVCGADGACRRADAAPPPALHAQRPLGKLRRTVGRLVAKTRFREVCQFIAACGRCRRSPDTALMSRDGAASAAAITGVCRRL